MPVESLMREQAAFVAAACAVAAGAAAVLAYRRLRAPGAAPSRRATAGLVALGAVALGLRLFVSPHTLMTDNGHGYELLRSAFQLDGYPYYGSAYYAFFHGVTAIFGRRPEVVFTTNALLGTVAVLCLVPLGRRLVGRAEAGWAAALAYACWPAALRIAAAETAYPLGICGALLTWLAWWRAWETGETVRFVLAAALLAVTVQTRPDLVPFALVLLLTLPLVPGWTRRLRGPGPWVAALVLVGLTSEWGAFRVAVQRAEGVPVYLDLSARGYARALVSGRDLLVRADWTPAVAWALVPLGLLALAARRWRALPVLLGGFVAMSFMVLAVNTNDLDRLRLQSPLHPLVALALGAGVAAVAERLAGRARVAAVVALGLTVVGGAALRFPLVRAPLDPQLEYAFLARTVPTLPAGCAIVTAPRAMAHGLVITEFPVWWLRGPFARADRLLRDPRVLDGYPCRLFYRGLSCYQLVPGEAVPPEGRRPECRALEERYRMTPLVQVRFPSRPSGLHRTSVPTISLGFDRLEERAPGAASAASAPARRPRPAAAPGD